MPLTKIQSLGITDGTIVNADINASAAIDSTKLSGLSSDFVLLASTDASSSASVSFDGYFTSTYKNYKVIVSSAINATNNQNFLMRFRRSNADVTASNYNYAGAGYYINSSGEGAASLSGYNATSFGIAVTASNASGQNICNDITIFDPLGTNNHKHFASTSFSIYNSTTYYGVNISGSLTNALTALSGVTFFFSSGNITSGNFKLYGIK